MNHRLLKLLAGVSVVLCVAIAVLWAASYWFPWSTFTFLNKHRISHNGIQTLARLGWYIESRAGQFRAGSIRSNLIWDVPYWRPFVLLLILWGIPALMVDRRRKRIADGLCPVCGYDLRATPDRCPECGAVPAKSLTAK